MRLYLDTNVYVSKYKDEFYGGGLPAYARYSVERLLERALACEFFVVSSDLVLKEVTDKFGYYAQSFGDDLQALDERGKLVMRDSTTYIARARALDASAHVGWGDCTHLLLCKDAGAAFVTWERKLAGVGRRLGLEVLRPTEV